MQSFEAKDAAGNVYVLYVRVEQQYVRTVGMGLTPHGETRSIVDGEGNPVNRLGKGRYSLMRRDGDDVELASDSPDAP